MAVHVPLSLEASWKRACADDVDQQHPARPPTGKPDHRAVRRISCWGSTTSPSPRMARRGEGMVFGSMAEIRRPRWIRASVTLHSKIKARGYEGVDEEGEPRAA